VRIPPATTADRLGNFVCPNTAFDPEPINLYT
jgi:hypothetical protein